jgi:hypothetical protein
MEILTAVILLFSQTSFAEKLHSTKGEFLAKAERPGTGLFLVEI